MRHSSNGNKKPPKLFLRFFRWYCHPKLVKHIEGDLMELYGERVREFGKRKADIKFIIDVLLLFRPGIIRSIQRSEYELNYYAMLRHNFLIAIRSFNRHKGSFFINMTGLSTGLACALLISLWVSDELKVDKFHEKDSQLFQVMTKSKKPSGDIDTGESTPHPLAKALEEEMPEVEYAVPVRISKNEQGVISVGDKYVRGNEQYVGGDYFNVFSYHLIQGDKDKVLTDKYSVIISEELAGILFNTTENIIGKSIEWNKAELSGTYFISGIFKKPPLNATARFDLLFSYQMYREKIHQVNEWSNGGVNTYVILKENTDLSQFNEKIGGYLQMKNNNPDWSLFIRPYSDQYLYGNYENGVQKGGRVEYVRLFSVIAIFILAIGCINFMNLSTAKASDRIKEIGIKKATGVNRKAIIFQFLSESILMVALSLVVSIILVALLLPQFNQITGKHLNLYFDPVLILSTLGIILLTGLISGSYPAFYLSGFKPVMALKGKLSPSTGEAWTRRVLVVFQFALSVILIVGVLVVYKQIEFIHAKNLGYDKDNIILFGKEGRLSRDIEPFLNEVKNIQGVVNASHMWGDMTRASNITSDLSWEGKGPEDKIEFGEMHINYDLIETLGMEIKEGRSFSRDFITDNSKIIFNEAAIDAMGLKGPIGKVITLWGEETEIIGVVKNFQFESLYESLRPCFLHITPYANYIVVKIKSGKEREAIEKIGDFYQAYNEGLPFDFKFLDQQIQNQYVAEQRVSVLSRYFAGIAIIISCLGLFGLVAFTVERRVKEIGVRKVLGASEWKIVKLLSGDFSKMVLIAIVVALPISFYVVNYWLDRFAYSINLEWWYFVGAGLLTMLIALLTVSFQSIKAALANPVDSLRME